MVVLLHLEGAGEAQACRDLNVVVGQVLTVAAAAIRLDKEGLGEIVGADLLEHVVLDAARVAEIFLGKLAVVALDAQAEGHVGVDHGLAAHGLTVPLVGDVDRGKDLEVRTPFDGGTGALFIGGFDLKRLLLGPYNLALLEVQGVLVAVAPDRDVHVFGGVLGCA